MGCIFLNGYLFIATSLISLAFPVSNLSNVFFFLSLNCFSKINHIVTNKPLPDISMSFELTTSPWDAANSVQALCSTLFWMPSWGSQLGREDGAFPLLSPQSAPPSLVVKCQLWLCSPKEKDSCSGTTRNHVVGGCLGVVKSRISWAWARAIISPGFTHPEPWPGSQFKLQMMIVRGWW